MIQSIDKAHDLSNGDGQHIVVELVDLELLLNEQLIHRFHSTDKVLCSCSGYDS